MARHDDLIEDEVSAPGGERDAQEERADAALLLVWLAGACTVNTGNFAGKTCNTNEDCPFGYTCTEAHGPLQRTCEVLLPDVTQAPACLPQGPPLFYCGNVATILTQSCANCHTNPLPSIQGQNIPDYFRLDQYEDDTTHGRFADGGYVLGAKSMALAGRIQVRATCQRDMPPAGFPEPTDAQRQAILDWAGQGAIECDGGSSDGGVVVSFAADIVPLFVSGTCTACHSGVTPFAGLNLAANQAYTNLVGVACATGDNPQSPTALCDGGATRVIPFDAGQTELWLKINNDPSKCGAAMPQGVTPFAQADPDGGALILQWIQAGAPDN